MKPRLDMERRPDRYAMPRWRGDRARGQWALCLVDGDPHRRQRARRGVSRRSQHHLIPPRALLVRHIQREAKLRIRPGVVEVPPARSRLILRRLRRLRRPHHLQSHEPILRFALPLRDRALGWPHHLHHRWRPQMLAPRAVRANHPQCARPRLALREVHRECAEHQRPILRAGAPRRLDRLRARTITNTQANLRRYIAGFAGNHPIRRTDGHRAPHRRARSRCQQFRLVSKRRVTRRTPRAPRTRRDYSHPNRAPANSHRRLSDGNRAHQHIAARLPRQHPSAAIDAQDRRIV